MQKTITILVLFLFLGSFHARAKSRYKKPHTSKSAISNQIDAGAVNVVVMGDSLADGVWMVLREKFKGRRDVRLTRYTKVSSGICRIDFYDWVVKTRQIFSKQRVDYLVIIIGGNDKQNFVYHKGASVRLTKVEEWDMAYEKRVREITSIISDGGVKQAFWIGLPSMRSQSMNNHAQRVNQIYKKVSEGDVFEFSSSWELMTDENGRYKPHQKDEFGRIRNMRSGDGVHMTFAGYARITEPVYQKIISFLESTTPIAK